jgi:hypothetical protein
MHVLDLCAVAELIAVLVCPLRLLVAEVYGSDAEFRKRVQLARLGDAVVIGVLSQPQG